MGKKILIVNYEPKSLSRLSDLVEALGFEAITAKNGLEALEAVKKSVPDLAIIDPMLPKLSGFDVAQKLTANYHNLPIIMVTSVYKGNRYRTEAITKYGVKEYIEEPFEDAVIQSMIQKHLPGAEPRSIPKKKASAQRRLEEILEETMSGRAPSGKSTEKPSHPKSQKTEEKEEDDQVLTAEEIFSDVIRDVEKAPGILNIKDMAKDA